MENQFKNGMKTNTMKTRIMDTSNNSWILQSRMSTTVWTQDSQFLTITWHAQGIRKKDTSNQGLSPKNFMGKKMKIL